MVVRVVWKDRKGREKEHCAVYKLNGLVKGWKEVLFCRNHGYG
jgi:hypothetical protein